MTQNIPIISTIIPTRNRPDLVYRAVESALNQTWQLIEVIVVIDGPDDATVETLDRIKDPRFKKVLLPENCGVAAARNAGIQVAKGSWIALLDDDDQWLPEKLEYQMKVAKESSYILPIISCRFFAQTANGELIWPRRLPFQRESIGEYLFVRNSAFLGESFIATPTLLIKKELLIQYPFDNSLVRHEDLDWLVRVSGLPGVGLEFVSEPMAIINAIYINQRKSLSNTNDWKHSLEWIRSVRHLVSRRVYSGCITTVVSSQAALQQDFRAFLPLLWESIRLGKPRLLDITLYLTMWLVPKNLRQQLRYLLTRKKKSSD